MRRKKMLLVLPVLAVPFITMAFWALGGGKSKEVTVTAKGLNLELPKAQLKDDKGFDKLSFYDQAEKDSLKKEEWIRNDPYFKDTVSNFPNELDELTNVTARKFSHRLNLSPYEGNGAPEDQVLRKLKLLQNEVYKKSPVETLARNDNHFSVELDQLNNELKVNEGGSGEDPEMKQLENTLDKILDIQHPARVKERSQKIKDAVYALRSENVPDTLVEGFYSYTEERLQTAQNSVEAIIATTQTIVNGSVIKFRVVNDFYVNGKLVPKNTFISGIASLADERLIVEINSIRSGSNLFHVKLEVYDLDGLPGIYIPGTINRDVAKESANNSLSLLDMPSMDPSFKAQATTTGIGALKNLISKKVKLVKVQVKPGYKVLLKNK